MQTTLTINDRLFAEVTNFVAEKNPDVLIALSSNHKKRDIRELVGKVGITTDYDYKKLRIGE